MRPVISILATLHAIPNCTDIKINGIDLNKLINQCSIKALIVNNFFKFLPLHKSHRPENFAYLIAICIMCKNKDLELSLRKRAIELGTKINQEEIEKYFEIDYLIKKQKTELMKSHKKFIPKNYIKLMKMALKLNRRSIALFIYQEAALRDTPIDIVELFKAVNLIDNLVIHIAIADNLQMMNLYHHAIRTDNNELFIRLYTANPQEDKAHELIIKKNECIFKKMYFMLIKLWKIQYLLPCIPLLGIFDRIIGLKNAFFLVIANMIILAFLQFVFVRLRRALLLSDRYCE